MLSSGDIYSSAIYFMTFAHDHSFMAGRRLVDIYLYRLWQLCAVELMQIRILWFQAETCRPIDVIVLKAADLKHQLTEQAAVHGCNRNLGINSSARAGIDEQSVRLTLHFREMSVSWVWVGGTPCKLLCVAPCLVKLLALHC